jgi:hypothetical protein
MRQGTVYPRIKYIMTQKYNPRVLLQTPATFLPRRYNSVFRQFYLLPPHGLMGDPTPVDRHMTTAFAGRHTAGSNAVPEVCKLKPTHHLLT